MSSFRLVCLCKNAQASGAVWAGFSAASSSCLSGSSVSKGARPCWGNTLSGGASSFQRTPVAPASGARSTSPSPPLSALSPVPPICSSPSPRSVASTSSSSRSPSQSRQPPLSEGCARLLCLRLSGRRAERLSASVPERANHTRADRRGGNGEDTCSPTEGRANTLNRSESSNPSLPPRLSSVGVGPSALAPGRLPQPGAPAFLRLWVPRRCTYTRAFSSDGESGSKYGPEAPQPPAGLHWSWWELYVKGVNPEYPPRQRMFAFLTAQGVDVLEMEIREIEDVTRWLEMSNVYGEKFPRFPYDVTFQDKIEVLKEKYPLAKKN
ncbi:UNVERIFIED_CONTAM: hypothetical protein HHA_222390 [Hammondia hammondi]|eukprot:XP_008886189.1 hypothetical protein HHA_222390 [Hammondia hammondi]